MGTNRGPGGVFAHRGASGHAPEHTTEAYDLALAMGADRLELDVRSLADGTLVVLHDPTLFRTAADPRAATELTLADLAALPASAGPLTLDAVFARYGRDARYLVELKAPTRPACGALMHALVRHGLSDRVEVQSFDHPGLRPLRATGLPLAAIYQAAMTPQAVRRSLPRVARWASAVTPCASSIDAALVAAAHARGLAVYAYTVNDAEEMERLIALGADAIITDLPDRLVAVAATPALVAA